MKLLSTRNSGVKYLESQIASLFRAVPFSHVQSANANGTLGAVATDSAADGATAAAPAAAPTVAAPPTEVATTPELATAGCAATAVPGVPADGTAGAAAPAAGVAPTLDSNSVTRLLSSSTSSRSTRSRSVKPGAGASNFFAVSFDRVSLLSLPPVLPSAVVPSAKVWPGFAIIPSSTMAIRKDRRHSFLTEHFILIEVSN